MSKTGEIVKRLDDLPCADAVRAIWLDMAASRSAADRSYRLAEIAERRLWLTIREHYEPSKEHPGRNISLSASDDGLVFVDAGPLTREHAWSGGSGLTREDLEQIFQRWEGSPASEPKGSK